MKYLITLDMIKRMELAYCLMGLWVILKLLQAKKRTLRRHRVKLFLQWRLQKNYMSLSVFLSSVRVYHNSLIVERAIWSKERSGDWWDRIVVKFGDEEWRENF